MTFKSLSIAGVIAMVSICAAWYATSPNKRPQQTEEHDDSVTRASSPSTAAVASGSHELDDVRRSVRALSQELEHVKTTRASAPASASNDGSKAEPEDESDVEELLSSPSLEEQQELEHQDGQQIIAAFDTVFSDESRDSAWATTKEGELEQVFDSDDLEGAQLVDAECKSKICRVVVDMTLGDREHLLQNLMRTDAFGTSGFFGPDPDEPHRVRMFVSREGTSMGDHPGFDAALGEANG